jgi:ElaB/YqjD/DUF883 family membrane-anchored ribosome-binding protein
MEITMPETSSSSLSDHAHRAANGAEDVIRKGEELFKKGVAESKERINKAVDVTATRVEEAQAYVTRQAREKPMQTTAIAAGAGLLLGLFLAGRRR